MSTASPPGPLSNSWTSRRVLQSPFLQRRSFQSRPVRPESFRRLSPGLWGAAVEPKLEPLLGACLYALKLSGREIDAELVGRLQEAERTLDL